MFEFDERISDWDNTVNFVKSKDYVIRTDLDNVVELILAYWDMEVETNEDEEISLENYLKESVYDLREFDYYC